MSSSKRSETKQRAQRARLARKRAANKALGERIKAARWVRDWTQRELAARLGCESQQISHWETGFYAPSADNLRRLAGALGVSVDFLVGTGAGGAGGAAPRAGN